MRNIIIIQFIIINIFILTTGSDWPTGCWLVQFSCHPSFALIIVNLSGSRAGRQAGRSPGLLSSVQSPHRHKPNGKNKICESLMCFLTVCIYNLQICWSWSWNATSQVEANSVPDKKLSELDSITIICPRDVNEV